MCNGPVAGMRSRFAAPLKAAGHTASGLGDHQQVAQGRPPSGGNIGEAESLLGQPLAALLYLVGVIQFERLDKEELATL